LNVINLSIECVVDVNVADFNGSCGIYCMLSATSRLGEEMVKLNKIKKERDES
jgi:hypothetical protein